MIRKRQTQTRGELVIEWIETHCRVPSGKHRGKPVMLSIIQC
jgi:hypothetical protein